MDFTDLYINGTWVSGASKERFDVLNPATEDEIVRLPHADKSDLCDALNAAVKVFAKWRHVAPIVRARSRRYSLTSVMTTCLAPA